MTITSLNFYYAKPGNAAAVLRQRLAASGVREKLGLPRGRVLSRIEGAGDLPDVMWQLDFDSVDGHHADMAVRAASPEFEAIRLGMRRLYRRFERPLYERCGSEADIRPTVGISQHIVLINIFSDFTEDLPTLRSWLARMHEHNVNADRMWRLITEQCAIPQIIWEIDEATAPARADLESLSEVSARVERSVWRVEDQG